MARKERQQPRSRNLFQRGSYNPVQPPIEQNLLWQIYQLYKQSLKLTAAASDVQQAPAVTPPAESHSAETATLDELDEAADEVLQQKFDTLLQKIRKSLTAPSRARKASNPNPTDLQTEEHEETEENLEPLPSRIERLSQFFAALKTTDSLQMIFLVMYDIENNRVRTHLANYLEQLGLRRIQKSVFLGRQDRRTYQRMYEAVKTIQASYDNNDSVIFMPIAEDDLRKLKLVGKEVDLEYTLYDRHTWVF